MRKFLVAVAGMLLLGCAQWAIGQTASDQSAPKIPANDVAKIQGQLRVRYLVTKTTPDGADIVDPGTILVLQKDNLIMNKVYLQGTQRSSPVENVYENGEITQVGLLGTLSKINSFLSVLGNTESQSQAFGRGGRFWVTAMQAKSDGALFRLLSDTTNNTRYHAILTIPYGNAITADEAVGKVADVLATDPPYEAVIATAVQATPAAEPPKVEPTPAKVDEVDELRRAAEGGDATAMFQFGNVLAQRGENVEAVRWFRRSSENGNIKATNALGYMYEEGRGVPQNYEQASSLYLQAMKGGNSDAMVNRAIMFTQGQGVKKDPLQAYMHLLLAAAYATDQETRDAAVKLKDDVAAKLSKQQITRGQVMADKFAKEQIK